MKVCRNCKQKKLLDEFYASKNNKDGHKTTCKDCDSILRRSDRYGLSYDQIMDLFSNGCMICGTNKKLHIDHDSDCCPSKNKICGNCIRGSLCMNCNQALGYFKHNPDLLTSAIRYLEQ